MSSYRPALEAILKQIEHLDAADVAALTSPAVVDQENAAQGRRALALGGHGEDMAAIDKAVRDARPDLSRPARVALRWAVLAETYRDTLTDEQYRALMVTPASVEA
ncbi:hypothetical protein [uncultured Georgenia sp.]|uniref:hypothetical protein n=1 Tax=uncultured Georgenia sp. TaxID=378209 RepID=UPI0026172BDE|nr:hypothetical protein [uncultured Georgenia sp.]HLV03101.1 hypothetical protein [Actinomycetaceae bacterium]